MLPVKKNEFEEIWISNQNSLDNVFDHEKIQKVLPQLIVFVFDE